jgi:hypothetical protein
MKLEIDFSKPKLRPQGAMARILLAAAISMSGFFLGLFLNKLVAAAFACTMAECCGVFICVWLVLTIAGIIAAVHDVE